MEQAQSVSTGLPGRSLHLNGVPNLENAYWNLGAARLAEHAVQRGEGELAENGALVVRTGQYTGRSPKDKFIVRDHLTEKTVNWGPVNQAMSAEHFDRLYARMQNFWERR